MRMTEETEHKLLGTAVFMVCGLIVAIFSTLSLLAFSVVGDAPVAVHLKYFLYALVGTLFLALPIVLFLLVIEIWELSKELRSYAHPPGIRSESVGRREKMNLPYRAAVLSALSAVHGALSAVSFTVTVALIGVSVFLGLHLLLHVAGEADINSAGWSLAVFAWMSLVTVFMVGGVLKQITAPSAHACDC